MFGTVRVTSTPLHTLHAPDLCMLSLYTFARVVSDSILTMPAVLRVCCTEYAAAWQCTVWHA